MASFDQSLGKALIEPLKGYVGCMGSSPVLLGPLAVSLEAPTVLMAEGSPVLLLGPQRTTPLLQ